MKDTPPRNTTSPPQESQVVLRDRQVTTISHPPKRDKLHPSPVTSNSVPSRPQPFPSVQRVFLIQETVCMILEELPSQSLLGMGLSCRALYKPAMDHLWHTVTSLARLFLCLPKELVELVRARQYGYPVVSQSYY